MSSLTPLFFQEYKNLVPNQIEIDFDFEIKLLNSNDLLEGLPKYCVIIISEDFNFNYLLNTSFEGLIIFAIENTLNFNNSKLIKLQNKLESLIIIEKLAEKNTWSDTLLLAKEILDNKIQNIEKNKIEKQFILESKITIKNKSIEIKKIKKLNKEFQKKIKIQDKELKKLNQYSLKLGQTKTKEELTLAIKSIQNKKNEKFYTPYFQGQIQEIIDQNYLRINKKNEILNQKKIWQSSFDELPLTTVLVDENYSLIDQNKLAKKIFKKTKHYNKKCYELLFQRDSPCPGCQLGKNFKTEPHQNSLYQVSSTLVPSTEHKQSIYLNYYQDTLPLLKIETEFSESHKMTDLGLISSSIAHELNNPLAGMLSYTQLIKLQNKNLSLEQLNDLDMIESGIKKARDIVSKLLIFSRPTSTQNNSSVPFIYLIQTALSIAQLHDLKNKTKWDIVCPDEFLISMNQQNLLLFLLEKIFHFIMSQEDIKNKNETLTISVNQNTIKNIYQFEIKSLHSANTPLTLPLEISKLLKLLGGETSQFHDNSRVFSFSILIPRLDFKPIF